MTTAICAPAYDGNGGPSKEVRSEILLRQAMLLLEHFHSVTIIATYGNKEKTTCVYETAGNWYANCASVMEVAHGMESVIQPGDPGDDGDEWKGDKKA